MAATTQHVSPHIIAGRRCYAMHQDSHAEYHRQGKAAVIVAITSSFLGSGAWGRGPRRDLRGGAGPRHESQPQVRRRYRVRE